MNPVVPICTSMKKLIKLGLSVLVVQYSHNMGLKLQIHFYLIKKNCRFIF